MAHARLIIELSRTEELKTIRAGRKYILGRQGGSTLGIKRAPAKSVRRHSQDVAPQNYITKVTQRNTSVTKLSTSREDQIIGNIFFQS